MGRRKRHPKPVRHYVGVVTDVISGRRVVLLVNRKSITVKYRSGFSPVVGRTVRVEKHKGKWAATGPISDGEVTVPAGDDAPDLPASGVYGPLRPIYTGTWTGARWRVGDLESGPRNSVQQTGAAFYGTGPRVLLRGPVTGATLTLRGADELAVGTVDLWPVAESVRPLGAPTLLGGAPIASAVLAGTNPVDVDIPTTTELTSGAWGGFAIYSASATERHEIGTELDSLTLTMDWEI